jgi:hypothetical protein
MEVSILTDLCDGGVYLDLHREHGRRRREFDEHDESRDLPETIAQEWGGWWFTPHVDILRHDSEHRLSGGSGKQSAEGKKRRLSGKALRINQADPTPPTVPEEEPKREVVYGQIQHFHGLPDASKGGSAAKSMEEKLQEYKQRKEAAASKAPAERRLPRPTSSSTSKTTVVAAASTTAAMTKKTAGSGAARSASGTTSAATMRVPSRPPLQNRSNTTHSTITTTAATRVASSSSSVASGVTKSAAGVQPAKRARTEEVQAPATKGRATRTTATTAASGVATRTTRKASEPDTDDLVRQLLAEHNKKFKQAHTYEPRQHSVRETRMVSATFGAVKRQKYVA